MNLVKVKCAFCGREFLRRKGQFKEAKKFNWNQYCSWKCLSRDKIKRQVLFCKNCGKRFERTPCGISPHNYCSQSCAAIVNNGKNPKRKTQFKDCLGCGKQFRKSTGNLKYCSMKCRGGTEPKYTLQELIDIIKAKTQELGRVPARREIKESDACRKFFGSWNNAIIAADLQPNRSHSQRMYKRIITKAMDGHLCDSISEAIIDNWLTENKILHGREAPYPATNHKADWIIKLDRQDVFVEYFGLANDSLRYDRSIKEKRRLCHKNKISLIAIYPQDLYPKEFLEERLKNKFKKFLVT